MTNSQTKKRESNASQYLEWTLHSIYYNSYFAGQFNSPFVRYSKFARLSSVHSIPRFFIIRMKQLIGMHDTAYKCFVSLNLWIKPRFACFYKWRQSRDAAIKDAFGKCRLFLISIGIHLMLFYNLNKEWRCN